MYKKKTTTDLNWQFKELIGKKLDTIPENCS